MEEEHALDAIVTIMVGIDDPAALHAKAGSDYCIANSGRPEAFDEAEELFGPPTAPDVPACLRQLYDRHLPDAGIHVDDSTATLVDRSALRLTTTANASVQHLSPAELTRINAGFGMEPHGPTYRATEDLRHDGLYMSPKDHGFVVRVPAGDLDGRLAEATPEMAAIVRAAAALGANRIEFDADEEPVDGLPVFEH